MSDPLIYTKGDERVFLTDIANAFGIKTITGRRALEVAFDCVRVIDAKQQDYGPRNISDFGEHGILVRTNDKVQRLRHLSQSAGEPNNESIDDSWLDIANYGIIAQMWRRGLWGEQ